MRTLILTLIALSFAITANAGKGDGGGAGFKVGGKYITWDKAGLELNDEERAYDLDIESIRGLEEFARNLPFNEALVSLALGKENVFRLANKVGRTLKKRIRDEYALCFDEKEFKKRRKNFVLYALSRAGETFLLPEFFELDPISRGKILIHEAHVRAYGFSCNTLKFDEQLSIAYEVTLGNAERSEVKLSMLNTMLTKLMFPVNPRWFSHLSGDKKSPLVADFYNRGIEVPRHIVLSDADVEKYFQKTRSMSRSMDMIAKYMTGGHTNKYSRMDLLTVSELPDYLYKEVILLESSQVLAIRDQDKVREAAKDSQKMIDRCIGKNQEEVFVITLPGKDFWKLDTAIYLGKCEANDDGVLYAMPHLALTNFARKY